MLWLLPGCGDDDWGEQPEDLYTGPHYSETEIGPAGGVIEVTDPESPLHGFKVVIPEGAFASTATVVIKEDYGDPNLPAGLVFMGPEIEITADVPFLKEMQIYFPVPESTGKDGKMICAFYWDSIDASWWDHLFPDWRLEFPESASEGLMGVAAGYSGSWSWGEVLLGEVDMELLEPMADESFGPDFLDRVATALNSDILRSLGLINWENFTYCENRIAIGTIIMEIRDSAEIHAVEDLRIVNAVCEIWDHEPTVGDVFYGIEEVIQIHVDYLAGTIQAEAISIVPFIGDIAAIFVKAAVQATYEQRLSDLANEYVCLFVHADAMLWAELGLYFVAQASLLGMDLVQSYNPCP